MNEVGVLHDLLAELLTYPRCNYLERVTDARAALKEAVPEAEQLLAQVAVGIGGLSAEEVQELYTRTFELNPVCALEVGWHLYGENYARGEFLVLMRQELREHGVAESTELPDHLTHVLSLLGRMDQRRADRLLTRYVLPALEKMLAGLGATDSPYRYVLEAVRSVLTSPYGVVLHEVGS